MFKAARIAYKDKKYQDALDGFQQAFGLDPRPAMLYNIALCQQKLGILHAARGTLLRFLEQNPHSKARPKVEKKMAEIEAELQERDGADEPGQEPPPGAKPGKSPTTKPVKPEPYNRTGLSVYASLGVGALSSDLNDQYGSLLLDFSPSLGIGVGIMHRPLAFLAYGLRITWAAQGITSPLGTPDSAFFFETAGLVEFFPLGLFLKRSRFDPFIGFGAGYGQLTADLGTENWHLKGATLHISAGTHIFVNRWIAIGAVLSYKHAIWTTYCVAETCVETGDVDQDIAKTFPSMFFIGAEGAFHFL